MIHIHRGPIMPGEVVTILGGLASAALFFWRAGVGLVAQAGDAGNAIFEGVDKGTGIAIGGGFAALLVALAPLVDRILKHRETMHDSELKDRLDDLQAHSDHADRERAALKQIVAKMFPVVVEQHNTIQEDRALIRLAHAQLGDKLPLPEKFEKRGFDREIDALLSAGQVALLAETPPSREVLDIVEGRKAMPTPDPTSTKAKANSQPKGIDP